MLGLSLMKLERAQEYVTTAVAVAAGMILAYVFGSLSGSGQVGKVMVVLGAIGFFTLLLALREQIWMLIPLSTLMVGKVVELPGQPAIKDLAILAVFAGIFALRAFKIIRRKPTYQSSDFWIILMLLYLATCFIRNPVGGDALGSERVGGRPYLNVATAYMAYWVLARVALPVVMAQRAFYALVGLNLIGNTLSLVAVYLPRTEPYLARIIGPVGEDITSADNSSLPVEFVPRETFLLGFGQAILQALYASLPPLSLFNPARLFRFALFSGSILCVLLAGYRSALVGSAFLFALATYFRSGLSALARLGIIALAAIAMATLMQGTIVNLPRSVQRTLSFLPGNWDKVAQADADYSAEWRFTMWRLMLTTDRYISNKVLGDGFGMTAQQLQQSVNAMQFGDSLQAQESFMITGQVHSGPISTIRYVGYVGLVIFLCLLVANAREAWRLCRQCQGTEFFTLSMLICLPIIFTPFSFVFIYGSFDTDLPAVLISTGMLKMLRTSFEEYKAAAPARAGGRLDFEPVLPLGQSIPAHLAH